eukprot:9188983-Alexandrium_andersonii.AAC.1
MPCAPQGEQCWSALAPRSAQAAPAQTSFQACSCRSEPGVGIRARGPICSQGCDRRPMSTFSSEHGRSRNGHE